MFTRDTGTPEPSVAARAARGPVLGLVALLIAGCGLTGGSETPDPTATARDLLVRGDLPAASAELERLAGQAAESVDVAVAVAWSRLTRGDFGGADAVLAAVEPAAGDALGAVKLRRALVALKARDLDAVKLHAGASGLPQGRLLAAEVHLVDLESDEAAAILRDLAAAGGAVGTTASHYLRLLDSGDTIRSGLAEAQALWALGDREAACDAAGELLRSVPVDDANRSEQLLLWAGRAVTSGQADVAQNLLDEVDFPPEGQAWRVQATRALVHVAQDEIDEATRLLDALAAGGAPADGVADARATACAMVSDPAVAARLVGDLATPAVARCLQKAGAVDLAAQRAPGGPLGAWLESL